MQLLVEEWLGWLGWLRWLGWLGGFSGLRRLKNKETSKMTNGRTIHRRFFEVITIKSISSFSSEFSIAKAPVTATILTHGIIEINPDACFAIASFFWLILFRR